MIRKFRLGRMPKNNREKCQLLQDINDDAMECPNSIPDHKIVLLIMICYSSNNIFPNLFSMDISPRLIPLLQRLITMTTHYEQENMDYFDQIIIYPLSVGFLDKLFRNFTLHKYYNGVICNVINQKLDSAPTERNNNSKTRPCALFNRNAFKIPKLQHIVTIFLHRNIGACFQHCLNHTICDFSPQIHIFNTLLKEHHCPPSHLNNLLYLSKNCPLHNTTQVTKTQTMRLNKYNILIIKDSKFFKSLLTTGVTKKQLNRIFCEQEIHDLAFDHLYYSNKDNKKILDFLNLDTRRIMNFDGAYDDHHNLPR